MRRVLLCGLLLLACMPRGVSAADALAAIDHIPIAVMDLDSVSARYKALGFTLKPGRPHDNSLLNNHAKYSDGSELELLTATRPKDDLAAKYLRFIAEGDGPAFLALRSANLDAVRDAFTRQGIPFDRKRRPLKVNDPRMDYLFFSGSNLSPTDRPEHFVHANTTSMLIGVWLADAENHVLLEVLRALNAPLEQREVEWPVKQRALVATMQNGEITILPNSNRLIRGRPIVGAVLRTADLAAVERLVRASGGPEPRRMSAPGHESLLVGPEVGQGLWLEFRQFR
jgi:Glyoxalase-like domain